LGAPLRLPGSSLSRGAAAQHGLLDQRRGWVSVLGVRGAGFWPGDLRNVDPQDLRQAGQRAVAVNAAPAAFHLGQPRFGSPHQPGEDGLRQAPPSPGPRDPLPGRLAGKRRHRVTVLSGSAATTSFQGGNRRS
jgi:hypothetical protein